MPTMQQAYLEKHGWSKQGKAKKGVETYSHPKHGQLTVDHYNLKWKHNKEEGPTSYGSSPKHFPVYVKNLNSSQHDEAADEQPEAPPPGHVTPERAEQFIAESPFQFRRRQR